jgi:hypothetical protein
MCLYHIFSLTIRTDIMFVLLMVENCKLGNRGDPQWHDVHTKFNENLYIVPKCIKLKTRLYPRT